MKSRQAQSHVSAAQTRGSETPPGHAGLWVIPSTRSQSEGAGTAPQRLAKPKLVAIAKDAVKTPRPTSFPDPRLPPECATEPFVPKYGEDLTYGKSTTSVGHSAGKTEKELKPIMKKLVSIFAPNDAKGMADRLFTKFLECQNAVTVFQDPDLDTAVSAHPNAIDFSVRAVNAPSASTVTPHSVPTYGFTPTAPSASGVQPKKRIHQALAAAGWDINMVTPLTDLGSPGFVQGSKLWSTGDYATGLGVMIGGVQWVYVVATHYSYDALAPSYSLTLRFYFFDVFGLDREDVTDVWEDTQGVASPSANGITAWWQLQHQFGFAPLITRAVMDRTYFVAASV